MIFSNLAFHIEITPLADGTYELTQEPDRDFSSEAQANVVELIEAPNFNSKEPKFTDPTDTSTGKPRCIILLFQIIQLLLLFTCAFKLLELNENTRCIILGSYWLNTRFESELDALLIGPVKVE